MRTSARALVMLAASGALCACGAAARRPTAADAGPHDTARRHPDASGVGVLDASSTASGSAAPDGVTDAETGRTDAAPETGDADAGSVNDAAVRDAGGSPTLEDLPYARKVESFIPGDHAGYGQDKYPGVVLGPPQGKGTGAGSLDVLSLGVGGSIVLSFGGRDIIDGPGPDFIVFENPFWPGGNAQQVFADPGEVSVSEDGSSWHAFPCDAAGDGRGHYVGCAGWTPTLIYDPSKVLPLDPKKTGGDAFDLSDLGLAQARYVRIRDLATSGSGNTAGFDLDAVGVVHYADQP